MAELTTLFENNKRRARSQLQTDPTYFQCLAAQQTPKYLWIGCSDSRVPGNQILGPPGQVFVPDYKPLFRRPSLDVGHDRKRAQHATSTSGASPVTGCAS